MKTRLKIFTFTFLVLAVVNLSHGQKKTKTSKANIPTGTILDQEKLLTPDEKTDLEAQMKTFIYAFKTPMGILIMPSPKKADPNKRWTVEKTINPKGIMIMLSATHKEIRLGLGPELSKKIPDQRADQIAEEIALSDFQNGQYHAGLSKMIKELTSLME